MTRLPTPTFNDVVLEIYGFDTRLRSYKTLSDVSPHLAFQTHRSPSNTRQRCRNFNPRFGSNRGRGGFSILGMSFSQLVNTTRWNQSQPSSRFETPCHTCQICSKVGHSALKCFNNGYQSDDIPRALSALQIFDAYGREWFLDSGASAHITSSTTQLQSSTPTLELKQSWLGTMPFFP